MAQSTDIGQPKAVYFRRNFIENGKKKSKWVKIPGVYMDNFGTELQIKTGRAPFLTDKVTWKEKTTGILRSGLTQYTETDGE